MKKNILYIIVFLVFWLLSFSIFSYIQEQKRHESNINLAVENFKKLSKFLKDNHDWSYPLPSWDLILLDKTNTVIHLEDRNTPLFEIKNLSSIQWTSCDILKDNKEFETINYDPRFSIADTNGQVLHKRCFSYSVTADRKHFQIASIIEKDWKYMPIIEWNSSRPILKSYNSVALVNKDNHDFLPYPASKISPILFVSNIQEGDLNIYVKSSDKDSYKLSAKEWSNVLLSGGWIFDISIKWRISPKSIVKFIDTNWSIIHINWSKTKWELDFKLKDYSIDTQHLNYFVETWRFLANIIRLDPSKDMTIKKDWVTLVIRWTRFTVSTEDDDFDTFVSMGSLVQKLKWWEALRLDINEAFSLIKSNKFINDLSKIKWLLSFSVFTDIQSNKPQLGKLKIRRVWSNMTDAISWSKDIKRFELSYWNWQKIWLVVLKKPKSFLDYIRENKMNLWILSGAKYDTDYYKDIVNQFCRSSLFSDWLDIGKFYYLLDVWENLSSFRLKKEITDTTSLNKYILYSNRKYRWQHSSRVHLDSIEWTINSLPWFKDLDYWFWDKFESLVFACDIEN